MGRKTYQCPHVTGTTLSTVISPPDLFHKWHGKSVKVVTHKGFKQKSIGDHFHQYTFKNRGVESVVLFEVHHHHQRCRDDSAQGNFQSFELSTNRFSKLQQNNVIVDGYIYYGPYTFKDAPLLSLVQRRCNFFMKCRDKGFLACDITHYGSYFYVRQEAEQQVRYISQAMRRNQKIYLLQHAILAYIQGVAPLTMNQVLEGKAISYFSIDPRPIQSSRSVMEALFDMRILSRTQTTLYTGLLAQHAEDFLTYLQTSLPQLTETETEAVERGEHLIDLFQQKLITVSNNNDEE